MCVCLCTFAVDKESEWDKIHMLKNEHLWGVVEMCVGAFVLYFPLLYMPHKPLSGMESRLNSFILLMDT